MKNVLSLVILLFIGNILLAQAKNDQYVIFANCEPEQLDILKNDIYPSTCSPSLSATTPKVGTVKVVGTALFYSPKANYIGKDSLEYTINCGTPSTAKIYLNVIEKPDNISDNKCFVEQPSVGWEFKQLMFSSSILDNSHIPLVGDIDNDGIVEILALSRNGKNIQYVKDIIIFKVKQKADGSDELVIAQTLVTPQLNRVNNPYSIADVDGTGYASIFLCTSHYTNIVSDRLQLIKYTYDPVSKEYAEEWRVPYYTGTKGHKWEMGQPIITDFNADGVAEILVMDKVFNAQTGALLADGNYLDKRSNGEDFGMGLGGHEITVNRWVPGSDTTWSSLMVVADIDNDGVPEVIGGNSVYKVNIDASGLTPNSFKLFKRASKVGHPEAVDGATAVADVDNDGYLDVVVTGNILPNKDHSSLYAWNPRTGEVMHDNIINTIPRASSTKSQEHSASTPFIGDIDGDGQVEICITGKYIMKAFRLDTTGTTNKLKEIWSRTTNDGSAATTMSMFDFDQNGVQEIIYRDQEKLRIIDGRTGLDKMPPINCISETGNEYPVIADVNNDQSAEIIVLGGSATAGILYIFGSGSAVNKWAPARKVWNQFSYSAVNINEDLSVPKRMLHPSTIFPGKNGELGDSDDVRPFNGYLQQQTTLNKHGFPLFLSAEVQILSNQKYEYILKDDKLKITATIHNTGSASLKSPFQVTVYKDLVAPTSTKHTYLYTNPIAKDAEVDIEIEIPNFSTWIGSANENTQLIIKVNDNGDTNNDQDVCKSNNTISVPKLYRELIELRVDKDIVFPCDSVTVDVLHNDSIIAGSKVTLAKPNPEASIVGNKIRYKPGGVNCCDRAGQYDTIPYSVCNSTGTYCDTSYLLLNILNCPEIELLDSCSIAPVMRLTMEYDADYKWQFYNTTTSAWENIAYTGLQCNSLKEGRYRVKLKLKNKDIAYTSKAVKLVVVEKTQVGGKWWYKMRLE